MEKSVSDTWPDNVLHKLAESERQKSAASPVMDAAIRLMETSAPEPSAQGDQRIATRRKVMTVWFAVFASIDRQMDLHFDPKDRPPRKVQPPRDSDGSEGWPNIDPKALKDPVARAQYEKALKANDEKWAVYDYQSGLRDVSEDASSDVERFLARAYSPSEADRKEFEELLAAAPLSESRKQRLRAAYPKK